ncbi:transglycosylase SLT domain-containing protein [Streptomyces sp. NPDC048664]|uniref:transglycosylase SLT domain-containing protein n=1 Tax=Streptomyces sp. NPDC048664 TaxID=3154505 RepID=UPI0034361AD7
MLKNTDIRARARALTKTRKLSVAAAAAAGCCAMVLSAAPSQAQTPSHQAPTAPTTTATAQQAAPKASGNSLDGWIRQSLAIMKQHGIPGSYSGIHRNVMRESSGNPMAINNWDVNAQNGIPSKGLLQVIDPTFRTYHVTGTSWNIYDPVANITAACNYAAHRYGSMDNVNSAY